MKQTAVAAKNAANFEVKEVLKKNAYNNKMNSTQHMMKINSSYDMDSTPKIETVRDQVRQKAHQFLVNDS